MKEIWLPFWVTFAAVVTALLFLSELVPHVTHSVHCIVLSVQPGSKRAVHDGPFVGEEEVWGKALVRMDNGQTAYSSWVSGYCVPGKDGKASIQVGPITHHLRVLGVVCE